mmetsp:Transcript_37935/g.80641  ORF Transcript_37935/g.80641 Transcript_37935/m.80641 type:complete len:472 (+) Transcript_37935:374-1789(+)
MEDKVPVHIHNELEVLPHVAAQLDVEDVEFAVPHQLPQASSTVPAAEGGNSYALHGLLLLCGQGRAPGAGPRNLLCIEAILSRSLELDGEVVPGLAIQVPTAAVAPIVRAENLIALAHHLLRWVEDLLQVSVPDDLKLATWHQQPRIHTVDGLSALYALDGHGREAPTIPVGGDKVLTVGQVRGPCAGLTHLAGLLWPPNEPLPIHHSILPGDAQPHLVAGSDDPAVGGAQLVCAALGSLLSDADGRGGCRRLVIVPEGNALLVTEPHRLRAAFYKPSEALRCGIGALDLGVPPRLRLAGVQASLRITIEPDLKLLPPIFAEGEGEGVDAAVLHLHGLWLPVGEGACDLEAFPRLLVGVHHAAAPGPEDQTITVKRSLLSELGVGDLAPADASGVGATYATAQRGDVGARQPELTQLFIEVDRLVPTLDVGVELVHVNCDRHDALAVGVNGLEQLGHSATPRAIAHAGLRS